MIVIARWYNSERLPQKDFRVEAQVIPSAQVMPCWKVESLNQGPLCAGFSVLRGCKYAWVSQCVGVQFTGCK